MGPMWRRPPHRDGEGPRVAVVGTSSRFDHPGPDLHPRSRSAHAEKMTLAQHVECARPPRNAHDRVASA